MRKFLIFTFAFFICFGVVKNIKAERNSFEINYFDLGYEEISQSLQKSEKKFNRRIMLPTQVPPVSFTHIFGRFHDSVGQENDQLEIKFINKDLGQNHYTIRIKPIEYAIKIKVTQIDQKLTLSDGSEAVFSTQVTGFSILVFERNNLEYILSLDKLYSNEETKTVLVNIANSIP